MNQVPMTRWKRWRIFVYVCLIVSVGSAYMLVPSGVAEEEAAHGVVYIVPIENEIEQGLLQFMRRAFSEAEEDRARHIIMEMHTPGGTVQAAEDIGRLIRETNIPTTVLVNGGAISAGAYISLNADHILMTPGSTIGAATVVNMEGTAADAKAQSMWVQAMIEAALLNDRDPLYAEAMVDPEIEIDGLTQAGSPLSFGANSAYEYGYAENIVTNMQEAIQFLELDDAHIVEVELSAAENLARFITHPLVVSILLSLASLGLILELYNPGFGIPGAVGIASLLLFFFGHLVAGFAGWESLILFIVGVVLIAIELFVPGFGIFGILGLASVAGGLVMASRDTITGLTSLAIAIVVSIVAIVILGGVMNKKGMFHRLVLQEELNTNEGQERFQQRSSLIGQEGVTLTKLRPSGTISIGNKRYDVVTDGTFIDSGRTVEVVLVEGTRIVVREVETADDGEAPEPWFR